MSQPIRPAVPPRLRPAVIPGACVLVAVLLAPPVLAQSASGTDDPTLQEGQPSESGKKKKAKQPKLSKEQKRRLDIESGGRTAIAWYQQAVQTYRAGKYLDARAILLPLEDSARAIDIQEQVKLLIADTYFAQGGALNLAEALARYKSFATFFPTSEHGEYVQFQIGRSYFKQLGRSDRDQSYTDSVVAEYSKFLDLYPRSQYADQARRERTEAIVLRARHEYKVAQFYWEWKDYRACATRLKGVLKDFPELPEREKALWMCAQSLYNSGARAEGDSYAARLAADYPGSAYVGRLDAGAAGGRAIQAQLERQRKADKQADRTHRRQLVQDRKRTRQIRKDSGLPADVPGMTAGSPAATTAPAAAPAAATDQGVAPGASAVASARDAELAAQEMARREQAEKDEQAQIAKRAQQEAEREQKQQQEAEKAAAKEQARLAKTTPEQAAKQAQEDAAQAARDKKVADRLEAEEAEQAEKKAEAQRKRDEKAAAEAEKKAAKEAKKKK